MIFYLDLLNKNDIVNLVDYNIFIEDCIDKKNYYILNNNVITNKLTKINDSYFTLEQVEQESFIDNITEIENYKDYYIIFTTIVEKNIRICTK